MWNFDNASENVSESLIFSNQYLEQLGTDWLWKELCPFLTVVDLSQEKATSIRHGHLAQARSCFNIFSDSNILLLQKALCDRGYFRLNSEQMNLPKGISDQNICELLAAGVKRLVSHGYPPSFIMMYDEAWLLGDLMTSVVQPASGNHPIGDWFVFYVDPSDIGGYKPGPPHRDRPTAGESSFNQATGTPLYCSSWLALTNATPDNSCLYVLPKANDVDYLVAGDSTDRCLSTATAVWPNVVAQPLAAGGMLTFSHRLLHWGSCPQVFI